MSGRIVYTPSGAGVHHCRPGVEMSQASNRTAYVSVPLLRDFPRGTVWQCDDCGRTWVSLGLWPTQAAGGGYSAARLRWKREGFWARRRRLKASTAAFGGAVQAMGRDSDSVPVVLSDGGRLENPYGDHRSPPEDQSWLEVDHG
jgi:hypothetical protein